jgi:D-glycero-D-manno-heptose 1,7-bisphosphate phosphatase
MLVFVEDARPANLHYVVRDGKDAQDARRNVAGVTIAPRPARPAGKRAVFLDRDGVVIRAIVRQGRPYPVKTVEGLQILPGAAQALARLKALGFILIVVTNQPDVARGDQRRDVVEAINARISSTLPIDDVLVCFHDDRDRCECRKPLPGLILQGAAAHNVDLTASFLIGDRWRDIAAGRAAGVRTLFIDYGYAERRPEPGADATVANVTEAADWIVAHVAT